MKRTYTPTHSLDRILILSKLVDKPMRYSELWQETQPRIKSKETLGHSLRSLEKEGVIERNEKGRKKVIYTIAKNPDEEALKILSDARRIAESAVFEPIFDSMEFLAGNPHFSGNEEALGAAIGFWVEIYRNLCVLNALFSLAGNEKDGQDFVLNMRKLYQASEDKLFDLLHRFKKKHSPLFATVLEKKLFFKGINLRPSWVGMKLDEFLKKYYPKTYEKISHGERAEIYFRLLETERQKENIICLKYHKEFPRLVCGHCKFYAGESTFGRWHCKYRRTQSVREKIMAKRSRMER